MGIRFFLLAAFSAAPVIAQTTRPARLNPPSTCSALADDRDPADDVHEYITHLKSQAAQDRVERGESAVDQVIAVVSATKSRATLKNTWQKPEVTYQPQPDYPLAAKEKGITGVVRLSVRFGKDGVVQSVTVLCADPTLGAAATEAVRKWIFKPILMANEPVEFVTTIELKFPPLRVQ